MLRKLALSITFVLLFFCGNTLFAKDYEYTNLDIVADLKLDGTIDVSETFTANFFKKKHGIIRSIPLNYTVDNTKFHIVLDYVRVDGNKFYTYYDDGGLNIKIGDPNHEIKGEKVYPIFYSVYGLVRNFAGFGYSELYWNIVGYDFDTNINKVRAEIILPKKYNGFLSDDFLITVDGKSSSVRDFNGTVDRTSGDKVIITYNGKLDAGEGITLAIKFPKDYFVFDHDRQSSLLGYVDSNDNDGGNVNNYSSNSLNSSDFINPDSLSSIITFIIMIFGMGFLPGKKIGGSSSSGGSYSSDSGFSSGSSFSFGGFSSGGGGGGGGSRSW